MLDMPSNYKQMTHNNSINQQHFIAVPVSWQVVLSKASLSRLAHTQKEGYIDWFCEGVGICDNGLIKRISLETAHQHFLINHHTLSMSPQVDCSKQSQ